LLHDDYDTYEVIQLSSLRRDDTPVLL